MQKIPYRQMIGILLVSMILSLTVFLITSPDANASDEEKRPAPLLEDARKEGKVVIYGSTTVTDTIPLIKKFEGKYPFIKAEYIRLSGLSILNRILAEDKAGKGIVDVMVLKLGLLDILKSKGLLARYESPEHRFFAANVKDPEGYWTTQYLSIFVMGYNTNLVKPNEVPKNYEGLLNPKWKGNIALDYEGYDWFTGLLEVMGMEQGMGYMRKLAKQQPVLRTGESLLTQLLCAGEYAFAAGYPNTIESRKKLGAQVDWVKFDSPSPTSLTSAGILNKAPHTHAARLYYDYLLSQEAAEYLASPVVNRVPARTGIKPSWIPKDFKFFPLKPSSPFQEKYMKEFDKLFKSK